MEVFGKWHILNVHFLDGFSNCVVVKLLLGGSATNGATPSSCYSEPVNKLDLLHPLGMKVPAGRALVKPADFFMSLHSPLFHCSLESFLLHLLLSIIFPPALLLPFVLPPIS